MGISQVFDAPIFNPRYKTAVHIVQLTLILAAVILTIVRMAMPVRTTRGNMMALAMGLKSMIIIGYQLLTHHNSRFKRWASLKANAILNSLEIVFWAAAFFLLVQTNTQFCTGASCAVSWVVAILSLILAIIAVQAAVVSIMEFRSFKKYGVTTAANDSDSAMGMASSSRREENFTAKPIPTLQGAYRWPQNV